MARQGIPSVNETITALRNHFARGAVGGSMQGPASRGERPQRTAGGGATAGLSANPSRVGQPSPKGVGTGLVPNTTPGLLTPQQVRDHNFTIGHATRLMKTGHISPHQGQPVIAQATGRLDRHNAIKRRQAMSASIPKPAPSMGTLGGDGDGGPMQNTLLSSGAPSDIGVATAGDTGLSPLRQKVSGGRSAVPNSNSGFGGRGGPGYDY
jgi:hypothetical protein